MRSTLLAFLLLTSTAFGQATPPPIPIPAPAPVLPPGTPQAVASVKAMYPSGSVVYVDAAGSVSSAPPQFQVIGRPREPKATLDGGLGVIYPALPDGHYFVSVTALASKDFAGPLTDTFVVQFTVGAVAPDPLVVPTPAPSKPIEAIGKAYAAADVQAMAATWDENATLLAAGTPIATIASTFPARWQVRRTPAFADAGNAFLAINPAGTEPVGFAKDQLTAAWRDFAAGLRLGVK